MECQAPTDTPKTQLTHPKLREYPKRGARKFIRGRGSRVLLGKCVSYIKEAALKKSLKCHCLKKICKYTTPVGRPTWVEEIA